MTTLFRNATLVQLDPPIVRTGDLRQVDGAIQEIGETIEPIDTDEVVDCGGAVVMPGLVNGHTHLCSTLAVGMPAPEITTENNFETVRDFWWRFDQVHSLESVSLSGQIGALAAVRCGTTTLIDHHSSSNAIAGSLTSLSDAISLVGPRSVLCYETTTHHGTEKACRAIEENERYALDCQQRYDSRFGAMIGAHASFSLDDSSLNGCLELARQMGLGIHIHVAEDPTDGAVTRERCDCGLIERFQRVGLFDIPGSILADGTHFSQEDIEFVNSVSDNVRIAHNPSSNMNNAVGYTPAVHYNHPLLGTDRIGSDMWREARTAYLKSRDAGMPLAIGQPLKMLGESARVASEYLGVKLGVLEVGAAADLIVADYIPMTPLNSENLASHFMFAMGPEFVHSVMIGGGWCMRNRNIVSCNEAKIRLKSREVAKSLFDRIASIPCE